MEYFLYCHKPLFRCLSFIFCPRWFFYWDMVQMLLLGSCFCRRDIVKLGIKTLVMFIVHKRKWSTDQKNKLSFPGDQSCCSFSGQLCGQSMCWFYVAYLSSSIVAYGRCFKGINEYSIIFASVLRASCITIFNDASTCNFFWLCYMINVRTMMY